MVISLLNELLQALDGAEVSATSLQGATLLKHTNITTTTTTNNNQVGFIRFLFIFIKLVFFLQV